MGDELKAVKRILGRWDKILEDYAGLSDPERLYVRSRLLANLETLSECDDEDGDEA